MSINIHQIGEQIKKFRELRNYTQEGMSKELEMSPQGYGKIERNEVEITLQKLQRIADILGTTIADILGFEDRFVFHNREFQYNNIGYNQTQSDLQEYKRVYEERIASLERELERLHTLLTKAMQG